MKNIICFFTLVLCVMVSTVNAQNATSGANVNYSTSIVLSQRFSKVPVVIEDIDTEDVAVRNRAMLLEEVSPEAVETNIAGNYIRDEKANAKY
jgi:hypothetical protein